MKFIIENFLIKLLLCLCVLFNLFEVTKSSFSPDSGFSVPDGSSDSLSPECAKKGHASEPHNLVQKGMPVSSERLDYTSNLFSSFNGAMIR